MKLPLFVAVCLLFVSCKKYPDGPAFTLMTKTSRVANNWKIATASKDGKDVTRDYDGVTMDLNKKGDATVYYPFLGTTLTANGKWSFVNDKEKIAFDYDKDDFDDVMTILKLKSDEMWLKSDNDNTEYHFVTK